jgi:RNA polymerase sigma-70 factor (ECF subfamily)
MGPSAQELVALLQAVGRGDRVAFRALYAAAAPRLLAAAVRILRDRALAEDALQEAFLKVWRFAGRYDAAQGAPLAWMSVILRRAALDRVPAQPHAPLEEVAEIADLAQRLEDPALRRCLERLKDPHRKALILAYVYGYTHEELAEAMGAPLGTVKSWVRRAGLALKECMEG